MTIVSVQLSSKAFCRAGVSSVRLEGARCVACRSRYQRVDTQPNRASVEGYAKPTQRRQCSRISTMLSVSSSQYRWSNPAHISFFSGSFLSAPYIISW